MAWIKVNSCTQCFIPMQPCNVSQNKTIRLAEESLCAENEFDLFSRSIQYQSMKDNGQLGPHLILRYAYMRAYASRGKNRLTEMTANGYSHPICLWRKQQLTGQFSFAIRRFYVMFASRNQKTSRTKQNKLAIVDSNFALGQPTGKFA